MPVDISTVTGFSFKTSTVTPITPSIGEVFVLEFAEGGLMPQFTATTAVVADVVAGLESAVLAAIAASSGSGDWDTAAVIIVGSTLEIEYNLGLTLLASSGGGSMATIVFENGTDGLFDLAGKVLVQASALDVDATERRTTHDAMIALIGSELTSSGWVAAIATADAAVVAEESRASSYAQAMQAMAAQTVIDVVDAAVDLVSKSLVPAMTELNLQMREAGESIKIPAVTVVVAADGGNTGDLFIVATKRRSDGTTNAQILAEIIDVTAQTQAGSSFVQLIVESDPVTDPLSSDLLGGSGITGSSMAYFTKTVGLTGSGGVNAFTTSASTLPGNWIANVGTLGTDVKSGQPQEGTITVTGTPSAGTYRIQLAASALGTQSTISLPYNATAAQIQAAIVGLTGYASVVVTATGTTPNWIHTLKFYGLRETVTVTVVNSTTSGSFAIGTPVAYATPSLGSSPIVLISDGAALVSATILLSHLLPRTAYCVNAWLALNTAAASGVIEVSLTNGVGGTILTDDAGNNLSYTVNATDLTTAYKGAAKLTTAVPIFMTPTTMPASTYLRIRTSTTMPNTRQLFVENVIIAPCTQLYIGGPYVAAFSGPTGPIHGDLWSITNANDRAGTMSFMFERYFGLRQLGIYLPHTGSPTIVDIVLAT